MFRTGKILCSDQAQTFIWQLLLAHEVGPLVFNL